MCVAAASAQLADPVKSATADVNGDGKPDVITIAAVPNTPRFTLRVNGAKLTVAYDDYFDGAPSLRILPVNAGVKKAYVSVFLSGANDYYENRFFTYDGKSIHPAGKTLGTVTAPGNGVVYAEWWMSFWTVHTKYAPDASGFLRFVPQAGYYVGVTGTVKESFPVRVAATKSAAIVATVAPGSKVTLLLFQPYTKELKDDPEGYYLIKTQTGLCGWADYRTFHNKIPDLPFAG